MQTQSDTQSGFHRPSLTPAPRPAITRAAHALLLQMIARKQAQKGSAQ